MLSKKKLSVRRLFIDVRVPKMVISAHEREFPGMLIFYKHINSKLFRLKMPDKDNRLTSSKWKAIVINSMIVKNGCAFVHEKNYEEVLTSLAEAGVDNVMFALPHSEYSKAQLN